MNDASKDDQLPFLELNEEIPAAWAVDPVSSSSVPHKGAPSPSSSTSQGNVPTQSMGVSSASSGPRLGTTQYGLTPVSKTMLTVGAVMVLLMITFRVPPALVLLGAFSVLRVLFFPLAILGFVLWAWRYRR